MARVTLKQVRNRCVEGRFFPYDDWRDRLFVPPSILLVWFFVRLNWSGNAVSLLSGAFAAIGGMFLASSNPKVVAVGSFALMTFYLLDYVDGGVARFSGQAGIGGQYMDWTMHAVSGVGIAVGLFVGALSVAGTWIIPFGILTVIAATLTLDRYSLAWFAICMHHQQQRVKNTVEVPNQDSYHSCSYPFLYRIIRKLAMTIFHENYLFFSLPALALFQLFCLPTGFDFRVVLVIAGGVLYFPVVIYDIWFLATSGRVDNAYRKLFSDQVPQLPNDHFFY